MRGVQEDSLLHFTREGPGQASIEIVALLWTVGRSRYSPGWWTPRVIDRTSTGQRKDDWGGASSPTGEELPPIRRHALL